MTVNNVLELRKMTKEFNNNKVLDDVNFSLFKGEVHAIVGANGAGKSTLMKVINGVYINYQGEIILNGNKKFFQNPSDASNSGIAMIHQELDLAENLNVSENIYLGRENCNEKGIGFLNRHCMKIDTQELLDSLDFPIKADDMVEDLTTAKKQLVLIARTVSQKADVVIMDEPTSSLSINEIEKLFLVIKGLKERGVSVIYISHFLEEIFRIADRVTVLRDGKKVITTNIKDCTQKQVIEWMIGHKEYSPKKYIREVVSNEISLSVKGLTQNNGIVKDVSFDVRKGEVLGIAGVVGSGRTELLKMIFGAEGIEKGEIFIDGEKVNMKSPNKAVSKKLAFIPEDRKGEGLILGRTVGDNLSLVALKYNTKRRFIDYNKISSIVKKMIDYLKIKCHSENQEVAYLSGGNQQKVVLGKWLSVNPEVLLLDQPTRGVDIGAKEEIYELINSLAKQGTAVIFVSDELEEVLCLSDRILVIKKGQIVCEFDNSERILTKNCMLSSMIGDENKLKS